MGTPLLNRDESMKTGIQTKHIVDDMQPEKGYFMLKEAGFSCADFSLNAYLTNISIYRAELNDFFSKSVKELEKFFEPHKEGAENAGIILSQMHMPSPFYVPGGSKDVNEYLWNEVAPKSMEICRFFECPYIVIHGAKAISHFGDEHEQWELTEKFIDFLAPMAKETGITICMENLFDKSNDKYVEGPSCDAQKVSERIDRINEKYHAQVLGFCFDTGHANLAGIDAEYFITVLGHRLNVLHLHDNDGTGDLHQVPFISSQNGERKSTVNWNSFIRGLRNIHYDGVLNFETASSLSVLPEELKRENLKFIAGVGEYFSQQLG